MAVMSPAEEIASLHREIAELREQLGHALESLGREDRRRRDAEDQARRAELAEARLTALIQAAENLLAVAYPRGWKVDVDTHGMEPQFHALTVALEQAKRNPV